MAEEDDQLSVIEDEPRAPTGPQPTWKVAVIDDDPAVHDGTRFALYDYSLNGMGLEIISAHSAEEGRALLRANPDTAVVLLDVVMETETAGLDLVGFIREELKNETVRIILRTGQPGQAPERRVIVDYDINDYKAKTELTADKLFTSLTASLRSYQQLQRMAETRRGLEIIIDAAAALFDFRSMQRLAEGVLTQIASLLNVDCAGILVLRDGRRDKEPFSVLAGSGCYRHFCGGKGELDLDLRRLVDKAFQMRRHEFQPQRSVLYIKTASGREVVVLLEAQKQLSETDRSLVEVFCSRLSVAFDNVILYEQLQEANARLEERVIERTRELSSANARLSAQWERLRRVNTFKSEILGTVAHDLKNPLSVILGRTEMMTDYLEMQPVPMERVSAQIEHIRDSARRMIGMVDALVHDAMADAFDISIRREPVDLARVVQEVVTANRPLAEKKRQRVDTKVVDGAEASGDIDRLREAIDNVLSNAIKYTPVDGRIALSVERKGDEVLVKVTDSGPGLSPEDVSRLFGRFQRLSAKPTAGESSTGLGLSIVKRIVDLHGGRVTAESGRAGGGATFTIALPIEPPAAAMS
jgi:signal transduction histidine kinase